MTALAAGKLGYRVHVFDPETDCPASQVSARHTAAPYDDAAAIENFAASVDVVTFEFENVPSSALAALEDKVAVRPSGAVLHVVQDRLREKDFLNGIGVATTPYAPVASPDDLTKQLETIGRPAVLKGARLGYDGKGQVKVEAKSTPKAVWETLGAEHAILEAWVDYACEISVIAARGLDGALAAYAPSENLHHNHILKETTVPAKIAPEIAAEAQAVTEKIATALDLVGLLAVEFFVTKKGGLLVNELAPRPHNSGHWTMDACLVSQFEQFVRAVAGLPLGTTERHSDAVMTNLLGEEVLQWAKLAGEANASLHLYGKRKVRPGRKMGHVTQIRPKT